MISSAAGAIGTSGSGTAGSSAGMVLLLFAGMLLELKGYVFQGAREAALLGPGHPAERLEGRPGLAFGFRIPVPDEPAQLRTAKAGPQDGDRLPHVVFASHAAFPLSSMRR